MQRSWCISKLGPPILEPAGRWVWLRWHEPEAEEWQRSSEVFQDPRYCSTLEVPVRHLVLLWVAKGCFQHFDRRETLSNCVKKQQGQKSWCQSRSFVRVLVKVIGSETRGQLQTRCKGVRSGGILKRNSTGYPTDCLWNWRKRRAVDWAAGRSQGWACWVQPLAPHARAKV